MNKDLTYHVLMPRDGFFCKDGRGWFTDGDGRARSLDWPLPTTVLGALRTAWGRAQEKPGTPNLTLEQWRKLADAIGLECMLAVRRPLGAQTWDAAHRMWPSPADALLTEQDKLIRLRPEYIGNKPPTLANGDDPVALAAEALWHPSPQLEGKTKPVPRWWPEKMFLDWLVEGKADVAGSGGPVRRADVRLAIAPVTATAADGMLYVEEVMEALEADPLSRNTAWEWAVACSVHRNRAALPGNQPKPAEQASLGGGQRPARLDPIRLDPLNPKGPPSVFAVPGKLLSEVKNCHRLRLIAVTPLSFERGWLPDGCRVENGEFVWQLLEIKEPLVLRAAMVPRPLHVSGWDMVINKPKDTVRLVPPGSVYVVERQDGKPFEQQHIKTLWLYGLGRGTNEGFGRVVPGLG